MGVEDFKHLKNRVTFISGSSKNAGKTTFLNFMLPSMRLITEFVFMTIGIDGERRDLIRGILKPSIETVEGDIFLTSEKMLNQSDGSFRIVEVFPWNTVLGKLVVVKTVRRGLIELAGPENNYQLNRIISFIEDHLKIKTLIVDGAVNRITQIASSDHSGFYYICRITIENMKRSLENIRVISLLNTLNEWDVSTEVKAIPVFEIQGALMKNTLKDIPHNTEAIIIEDFTKVFLDYLELKALLSDFQMYVRKKIQLEAFVLNIYNIEKKEIIRILRDYSVNDFCIFNPYIQAGGDYE